MPLKTSKNNKGYSVKYAFKTSENDKGQCKECLKILVKMAKDSVSEKLVKMTKVKECLKILVKMAKDSVNEAFKYQ